MFWLFVLFLPFGFTGLVGYYYYRRGGHARGYAFPFTLTSKEKSTDIVFVFLRTIRLPGDGFARSASENGFQKALDTLASVPWFLIGIAGVAAEWVSSTLDRSGIRGRRGYRNVPIDEDAQILRFEDEA